MVLGFCFSLEQVMETHRNGMPHFVRTFSLVKDKLVLQKETEFDMYGQKVLEQTYSNGALVSKSKWDENGEKTAIRYKNKWTKKEISTFDDYECMEAEEQKCSCMRDIVLNELSYKEYYFLITDDSEGPSSPSIPQGLMKKVESVREKIKKECDRRGYKQESNSRNKEEYSYDFGDDYSDRDEYEVIHSYDFLEEHLMEIIRVAGNFNYSEGWLPSVGELMDMGWLKLDKAFLDYWSISVDWWIEESDLYGYIDGESKEGVFSFNISNRTLEYYKY